MSTKSSSSTPNDLPIILAPMAGGPSTPELVAAVSNAGGIGMLAAGYLTADKLTEAARSTAALLDDGRTFGINLFVPEFPEPAGNANNEGNATTNRAEKEREQWEAYRDNLAPLASELGAELPQEPTWSDDHFAAKIDAILSADFLPNPQVLEFVTFTFGYPCSEIIERVKASGRKVGLNATSLAGVSAAADAGADQIVLQGLSAGGHRGFVAGKDSDDAIGGNPATTIDELATALRQAKDETDVPIIAAGGIGDAGDVGKLLAAGATAVQVGTRFLTAREAGTKPTHRDAILTLQNRETMLTTAFSGKSARTISNRFAERFTESAPALYPQLHYLTTPIRGAAAKAGDPEYLNLWAGTGLAQCRHESASDVIADLLQSI